MPKTKRIGEINNNAEIKEHDLEGVVFVSVAHKKQGKDIPAQRCRITSPSAARRGPGGFRSSCITCSFGALVPSLPTTASPWEMERGGGEEGGGGGGGVDGPCWHPCPAQLQRVPVGCASRDEGPGGLP